MRTSGEMFRESLRAVLTNFENPNPRQLVKRFLNLHNKKNVRFGSQIIC